MTVNSEGEYTPNTPDMYRAPDAPASIEAADNRVDEDEPRPTGRSSKRNDDRVKVRRIATKYGELMNASPAHLELLSRALNVANNPVDLTIAVITGAKDGLAALNDTLALTGPQDPYEAIVNAISLGRPRIKGVWSVLAEIGAVSGPFPASDVKAGGAIAKAAGDLGQDELDEIAAVLTLGRK